MDKIYMAYLTEVKPGRAWSGKISRIDTLLGWMYDKGILTTVEKEEKDKIFRQYYRYYNDGDFPRLVSRKDVRSQASKSEIESALEEVLEDFIKSILKKYSGKFDKSEFAYDKFIGEMEELLRVFNGNDLSSMRYFGNKIPVPDNEFLKLYKVLMNLKDEADEYMAPVIDKNWPVKNWDSPHSKIYSFKKEALQKAGLWDKNLIILDSEIQKTIVNMRSIISNVIIAAKTARQNKML